MDGFAVDKMAAEVKVSAAWPLIYSNSGAHFWANGLMQAKNGTALNQPHSLTTGGVSRNVCNVVCVFIDKCINWCKGSHN